MARIEYLMQPGGLAEQLSIARRAAGLSQKQLAERLSWGQSKVSKIEGGRQKPSHRDVEEWASVCGLDEAASSALLDVLAGAESAHMQHRYRHRTGGAIRVQGEMDGYVRSASRIRNFEMFVVPGLIQTSAYATAIQSRAVAFNQGDPGDIDATVVARMRRQDVLWEPGRTFEFILLPFVLQPWLVPAAVMLEQLDKILSVSTLARVDVAIVPPPGNGMLPANPQEAILVLDDVVFYENSAETIRAAGQAAEEMVRRLDEFAAAALRGAAARALILAAQEEIRTRG